MSTQRIVQGNPVYWEANPGPQTTFLELATYETLYGGAAGGGKSDGLLAGAFRYAHLKHYTAIIFRRTFPDLERTLIKRSRELVPAIFGSGATYNESKHTWTFPSGAQLIFAHMEGENDCFAHQGAEYQYIAFDELTHFLKSQYVYLLSRGRSPHGIPIRIRNTTNPGGIGHEWVFERFAPWLNPNCPTHGEPGQPLWYVIEDDTEKWVPKGTPKSFSRVFIPARLSDNPKLATQDPSYGDRLDVLDPVTRKQLREGDWLVKPAAGLYFKKEWFSIVDAAPAKVVNRVRYWDLAASATGDWAVGVKMSREADGGFCVEHVERVRGNPGEVKAVVKLTAELDGKDVPVWIEQDPGQAGKDQVHTYATQHLVGWTVKPRPKRSSKVISAGPVSSQAQAKNIRLVRGPWNGPFLGVLESFPEGKHDDDVDGLSGAFMALTSTEPPAPWKPVFGGQRRSI